MPVSIKTKTIPALEVGTQLARIMKNAQGGRVRAWFEKSGVPMVGIISADEFQRVITEREVRFAVVDRIRRRVPAVADAEILRDVGDALKSSRPRRRA